MTATSTLSSSARRALRAAAHHLDPVVMMGQHGLTPAVLHEIDLALTAHALIKVRAGSDERETREGYLAEICQKLGCESVQHLGKLFVLWRNADGATDDDKDAEHDAAAVKAANSPRTTETVAGRGPRSKLASERATGAPSAGSRGAGAGSRGGAAAGSRGGAPAGERRRWGEAPPEPPRREGWAPKDRRGAARFGETEGGGDSRRRDGTGSGYGAPRGRAPAGGGGGYGSSAPRGTGAAPAGRSGYGGGNSGGYGGSDRGGAGGGQGGGQGYGERRSYGQGGHGDGPPRARWGDRREPAQGGGGYGGGGESSGGGRFGDDRGAPKQRSSFGRNSDAGAARPPRTGGGYAGGAGGAPAGGRGGWGSRDGVTGKPSGFSRGSAGGAGGTRGGTGAGAGSGAKPRARRRMG